MTEERVCEVPVIHGMASLRSGNVEIEVRERIVRCRECKHFTPNEELWLEPPDVPFPMIGVTSDSCDFWANTKCKVEPDGFCYRGETRDEQ